MAIWAVVGLLIGALGALQAQGFDGAIDRAILWDDLKGLSILGGLLAVVPADVGAGVGDAGSPLSATRQFCLLIVHRDPCARVTMDEEKTKLRGCGGAGVRERGMRASPPPLRQPWPRPRAAG